MTENSDSVQATVPRDIVVTNRSLENGNIEAWMNVIQSYESLHPDHEVIIYYEGVAVNNMISLYKMEQARNPNGFQLVVRAPDGNWKDVAKLYRYLVDGASANYERFIKKDIYQVLKLF